MKIVKLNLILQVLRLNSPNSFLFIEIPISCLPERVSYYIYLPQTKFAKVMFSNVCVCPQRGLPGPGGCLVRGCLLQGRCLVPGGSGPRGVLRLQVLLLLRAVRILLECILVLNVACFISFVVSVTHKQFKVDAVIFMKFPDMWTRKRLAYLSFCSWHMMFYFPYLGWNVFYVASNNKPILTSERSLNLCSCITWVSDIEHDYIRNLKYQSYKQVLIYGFAHRTWNIILWRHLIRKTCCQAVEDPGFLREGGANSPGGANIRFCQIFTKTAWNWKNLDRRVGGRGHASLAPPLDPPLPRFCFK